MRILHLPTSVGGGPTGLSLQLRQLGYESRVWTLDQDYLNYPVDRVIMKQNASIVRQLLAVVAAGSYVFGRWDIVHYNYGSTLYSNGGKLLSRGSGEARGRGAAVATGLLSAVAALLQRFELAVLRARRIPYFVHYQGDDARQGDYSLEHYEISIATQVPSGYYSPASDEWKRRQIALMSKHAAGVYAVNPDLLNVLPPEAEFVPYGHVDVQNWEPRYTQADRQRLLFAHAPSNRSVKGTDLILEALAELAAEGYEFDIDLIEGVSNDEALTRYAAADVVIDQLYAGWYGGVALEAMALGKPVVVYVRESDFRFLPPGMAESLPFYRATPQTVKEVLARILELPRTELLSRARQSREFVERWHDPIAIAARIAEDYREARVSNNRENGAR